MLRESQRTRSKGHTQPGTVPQITCQKWLGVDIATTALARPLISHRHWMPGAPTTVLHGRLPHLPTELEGVCAWGGERGLPAKVGWGREEDLDRGRGSRCWAP